MISWVDIDVQTHQVSRFKEYHFVVCACTLIKLFQKKRSWLSIPFQLKEDNCIRKTHAELINEHISKQWISSEMLMFLF